MFLLIGLGGIQSAAFSNQEAIRAAGSAQGGTSINKVASIEQLTYIASVIILSTHFPESFSCKLLCRQCFDGSVLVGFGMVILSVCISTPRWRNE